MASTSADKTLRIWRRPAQSQDWTALQVISYSPKMMESVSIGLMELDNSKYTPIIATGGVDKNIHLYVEDASSQAASAVKQVSIHTHNYN